MKILSNYKKEKGFYQISPLDSSFSDSYIQARALEARVYPDEILKKLPNLPVGHTQKTEWDLRVKSTNRFLNYLAKQKEKPSVLEIGCGNGWFSNQCATHSKSVLGIDINRVELEQASRVFNKENLEFAYWNIIDDREIEMSFDIIVINASVQYFEHLDELIIKLTKRLNPLGELHILDSPFYEENKVLEAKQRTVKYYDELGVGEMSGFYFHHTLSSIKDFQVMYQPVKNKVIKKLKKDIPFGWYKMKVSVV